MTATLATPPAAERLDVAWLDPRGIAEHPWNVRTDVGDLTGLTASIAAQGVLEPLVVVPLDAGGHQLVAGARRRAAAVAAGLELVPCIVRRDLAGAEDAEVAEQVAAMLAENLHRGSLTATEEARGVKLMLDLGVPLSKVAKRTGLTQKRVKLAIGVARLDDDTAAAVAARQLDLEQAAAVALFADEPAQAQQLAAAAEHGPGNFAHALERAKQQRKVQQEYAAKRSELQDAGVTLVESVEYSGRKNRKISELEHDGRMLTEETHIGCPGRGVLVGLSYHGVYTVEVCTDWSKHGHIQRYSSTRSSKPETEEEKATASAERRKVIENNKAMAAANTVRRAWIREFLARRTAPKEVLRFAVEEIDTNPHVINAWLGSQSPIEKDAEEQLGLQAPVQPWSAGGTEKRTTLTSGERVTDARLPLQLLAHVAGAIESTIAKDGWRRGDGSTARWLRFLAGQGYTLSGVEQQIVDAKRS
jgi:ParB family chromosome partitioning protein